MPYFRKFEWESVQPEYDPFKYNSFPKIAGHYTYELTRRIDEQIAALQKDGTLAAMPPVLTFQSLVDSTVRTPALVEGLYDRLVTENSELVLYDVNRYGAVEDFIRTGHELLRERLMDGADLGYTVTLVTNRDDRSGAVVVRSRAPGGAVRTTDIALAWPAEVYSLSHVAIPFPPDDGYYGDATQSQGPWRLGALQPRGEKNVLAVPLAQFMRIRHNPFFEHLEDRVIDFCEVCGTTH